MTSLFIYWKVAPPAAAAALAAAREWQAALRAAWPGLRTGLYQRADRAARAESDITVMETYAAPDGVGDAVQAAIDAAGTAGLQALGAPRRHVEVFEVIEAGVG